MDVMDKHMRHSDAFAWYMERDPLLRSTVVAIGLLDRPPTWKKVLPLVDRATRTVPMLRRRLIAPPLRLAPPRWAAVDHVDLGWHLRRIALPPPGSLAQLLSFAGTAASTAFDPARPLWEFTVVEGMSGGTAAFVMKFHHSLTDGIGGVQLALELFDLDRAGTGIAARPAPPEVPGEELDALRMAWDTAQYNASRLARLIRTTPGLSLRGAARLLRHPVGTVTDLGRAFTSVGQTVQPFWTTMSPVMRDRQLSRSLDMIDVPLQDLHKAAVAAGGHVNDAYLGAITGGLRRYHERHHAEIDQLRVTLPISLRKETDAPGGNLITLVRFPVPAGDPDPVMRMRRIRETTESWRNAPSLDLTQGIAAGLNLLPSAMVGSMLKHVDFLASNVPGFQVPVYFAGARVDGYYPFGPTIGSAVNFTLMSYLDTCCVGVNCDTAAIPDPLVLTDCIREGFDEVLALGGKHRRVRLPAHDGAPDGKAEEIDLTEEVPAWK